MKSNASERKEKRGRNWGRGVIIVLLLLAIIAGLAMMISPYLENMDHRKQVTQEVTAFKELVSVYETQVVEETTPEITVYPELRSAMEAYNKELYESGQSELTDAWTYEVDIFDLEEYGFGVNAVGLVTIPDISIEMPLYLGASYENLANGFAQLSQTSMPIGGENTNCVIAGHRGWAGMPYMRDVELLEIGDSIYLQNPWETLEYRISEIILIEPHEIETIFIQEGRDLLTLFTCHPYGVGSHRYVLICERHQSEETEAKEPEITGKWVWEWHDRVSVTTSEDIVFESSQLTIFVTEYLPWICLLMAMIILFIAAVCLAVSRLKKNRRK